MVLVGAFCPTEHIRVVCRAILGCTLDDPPDLFPNHDSPAYKSRPGSFFSKSSPLPCWINLQPRHRPIGIHSWQLLLSSCTHLHATCSTPRRSSACRTADTYHISPICAQFRQCATRSSLLKCCNVWFAGLGADGLKWRVSACGCSRDWLLFRQSVLVLLFSFICCEVP